MELWSPVSLLYELRQTLGSPPPEDDAEAKERAGSIVRLTAILEERGIGFERFLRPSFAGGQGILIGVIAVLAPRIAEDDVPSRLVEIGTRWRSILGIGDAEGTQTADEKEIADARLITSNVERTVTWAMSASLDELIEWWPSRGRIPEVDHQALSRMSQSDQWITDRFLATYLDHWSTEALHAEWDWIHGRRESPIPVATMRARKVDPVQLATQIADVAVEERADRSNPVAMGQYQSLAGRLLEEGRREAAVGVFEGVLTVEPHDPEAHNNRGFCLIPDDPAAAIPSLERAAELGYEPAAINAANRALALLQLGRLAAANELAETWFDRTSDRDPIAGMMWDPASVGSEPTLMPVRDTALYFAKIGREIANRASDEALQSCWASRIAIRAIATDDSAGE